MLVSTKPRGIQPNRWIGLAMKMSNAVLRAVAALAILFSLSLPASARRIDPGDSVKLAPDEGLLVVDVQAKGPVDSIKISRDGSVVSGLVLARLPVGRTVQLHAVKAGNYAWHEATLFLGWGGIRYG